MTKRLKIPQALTVKTYLWTGCFPMHTATHRTSPRSHEIWSIIPNTHRYPIFYISYKGSTMVHRPLLLLWLGNIIIYGCSVISSCIATELLCYNLQVSCYTVWFQDAQLKFRGNLADDVLTSDFAILSLSILLPSFLSLPIFLFQTTEWN